MASDQVVNAKEVLQALMEVRRVGGERMLQELEEQEPDLAEFCMEELSGIHQALLDLRAKPRQVRQVTRRVEALALVLVTSLRKAGLRLWREQAATGRLVQIDPSLSLGDGTSSSVPHPPIDPPNDDATPNRQGGEC